MFKTVSALVLALCFVDLEASETCQKLVYLKQCLPKADEFLNTSVSLKTVFWATSGGERGITTRCEHFHNVTSCLNDKMQTCKNVTDASDPQVVHWDIAVQPAGKLLCEQSRPDDIKDVVQCMSSNNTIQSFLRCEVPTIPHSRDACREYNGVIRCTDREVRRSCGHPASRLLGSLTRTILKADERYRACADVAPSPASGLVTSAPIVLGVSMATMTLLQQLL